MSIRQRQQATVSPGLGKRASAPPPQLSPLPGEPVQDDDGTVECPACEGEGTIRDGNMICPSCGGKGQVPDGPVTGNSLDLPDEARDVMPGASMSLMPPADA